MQLSDFDVPFDPALVAREPVIPRDRARLLTLDRTTQQLAHRRISDLPELLEPGDLLVVNDTKVMPARVSGTKRSTGRPVEVLFVKELGGDVWEIMAKGALGVGQVIEFAPHTRATILKRDAVGTHARIESPVPVTQFLQSQGAMPLPPYIKRQPTGDDRRWYQTIFAKYEGAIAAPTAGLHFTETLLSRLDRAGVRVAPVTLHVGPGTFKPIVAERLEDHQMGEETFEVNRETANVIAETKQAGRRVVAVGTTVVRALETVALEHGQVIQASGKSGLFIKPGFRFQVIDALMTNFHLPKTTLVMLVSAFAGTELVRRVYETAITERYRLYSYGDAMLIL
jgi:S-adenosylmethionine:tRNA ribosyltransferase-isomerase